MANTVSPNKIFVHSSLSDSPLCKRPLYQRENDAESVSGFKIYQTKQGTQGEEYLEDVGGKLTVDDPKISDIPLCKIR